MISDLDTRKLPDQHRRTGTSGQAAGTATAEATCCRPAWSQRSRWPCCIGQLPFHV